jgi:putative membrane protein insertion efficiency factor
VSTETASASSSPDPRPGPAAQALILLVEVYRVILSPLLGGFCRFTPSCSAYAQEALRKHGAVRGSRLAVHRLLRCHPFHAGGHDPVP